MIQQFNMENIVILKQLGYEVHVATNFNEPGNISLEKSDELKRDLEKLNVKCFQVDFARSPMDFQYFLLAKKQLSKIAENEYTLVHLHSPVGGIIGRIVFRNKKSKVVYTAHGFHFYEGAPLKNWLIFYPIEKIFSKHTDVLITINKEDYLLAEKKFKNTKVVAIPGIGVDVDKFNNIDFDDSKYQELGLNKNDYILICIGELNSNKNQNHLLEVTKSLKKTIPEVRLLLVGKGSAEIELKKRIKELNIYDNVKILGYREDIPELIALSDILVSASKREGLPVNIIEGLASSKPIVASNCRGNKDLVINDYNGYLSEINNVDKMVTDIQNIYEKPELKKQFEINSHKMAFKYDKNVVKDIMKKIY
ncbi:glycosyltransferase family 4 protein [Vagococcus carniphilus]